MHLNQCPFKYLLLVEPLASFGHEADKLEQAWRRQSETLYHYTYPPDDLVCTEHMKHLVYKLRTLKNCHKLFNESLFCQMSPHPSSTYAAMMALAEVQEQTRSTRLDSNGTAS